MAKQIAAKTLRDWLEAQQPVTVLDIRTDDDRAQWAIPGSVHLDAYDALRLGQPGALADAAIPLDRPVVTVCNAGRVSQTAAEMLAKRGFDALSLAGGMKAWSLAWNTAEVLLSDPSVRVVQVRRTGKGCLSYIVGSGTEAAVIDPSVSPEVYLDLAGRHGWSIRYVLETHVHADHLSRARELARQTGATLMLPTQQRVRFPFTAMADGERVPLGSATITAMHTPAATAARDPGVTSTRERADCLRRRTRGCTAGTRVALAVRMARFGDGVRGARHGASPTHAAELRACR